MSTQFTKWGGSFIRTGSGSYFKFGSDAVMDISTLLADGNTKGWFIASAADVSTVTIDSCTYVSKWADRSINGNHLIQNTVAERPYWDAAKLEINFGPDVISAQNLGKAGVLTSQPYSFYAVIKQNQYNSNTVILYFTSTGAYLRQGVATSGRLDLYAGIALSLNGTDLSTYGIVSGYSNSANSLIQWNHGNPAIGDVSLRNSDYIRVGTGTVTTSVFSIKEYIFRAGQDSSINRSTIINYLDNKYYNDIGNKLKNSAFDTSAYWIIPTGWNVSYGIATYDDTVNEAILGQSPTNMISALENYKNYSFIFDLSVGVTARIGIMSQTGAIQHVAAADFSTGTRTITFSTTPMSPLYGNTGFGIYARTESTGPWSIDNISLKEIL